MKILIVDDEKLLRWSINKTLTKAGYTTSEAASVAEAKNLIISDEPDIVLLDINLPDGNGVEILKWAKNAYPDMMFVMITARGRVSDAVNSMRLGAHDFLEKPLDMENLVEHLTRVVEIIELKREVWRLGKTEKTESARIVATSPPMLEAVRLAHTVAESEAQTILLLGESGSGKDLMAQFIHEHSRRRNNPFMVINCVAMPETLMESELFGYEKGAFTDAKSQKKGALELADGGTVFLDEIGEMKLSMQTKLLRVLENWSFKRVGGSRDISVDIRVIGATNRDLEESVREGDFREDLYYRLNVFPIEIPPLRDRPDDIRILANHFLKLYNRKFGKNIVDFSPDAMEELVHYKWPGNIRELRNVIERIMILQTTESIDTDDLPLRTTHRSPAMPARPMEMVPLEVAEKNLILRSLEETKGNVTHAAKILGVSRDRLRYKVKKHGI